MSTFEDAHIKWLKRRRCSLTLDVEIDPRGEESAGADRRGGGLCHGVLVVARGFLRIDIGSASLSAVSPARYVR